MLVREHNRGVVGLGTFRVRDLGQLFRVQVKCCRVHGPGFRIYRSCGEGGIGLGMGEEGRY